MPLRQLEQFKKNANAADNSDTGMELRDLLLDREFAQRRKNRREQVPGDDAMLRLARVFAENPDIILQELVDLAVSSTGADSAGISLEEQGETGEPRFRWIALAGSFAHFLDGTTPRFFSPCGTCLSSGRSQLYRVSKPYYDFLGITAEPISDGLLIPWVSEEMRGTLWVVSHESEEAFDLEDYHLLNRLAEFASLAVKHRALEKIVRRKESEAASVARANEMAHQINNPLQSLANIIYLAQQGGPDTQLYLRKACVELTSLSDLVKKLLA
jgi:hypothetical protein